jgi:hypothetical protein
MRTINPLISLQNAEENLQNAADDSAQRIRRDAWGRRRFYNTEHEWHEYIGETRTGVSVMATGREIKLLSRKHEDNFTMELDAHVEGTPRPRLKYYRLHNQPKKEDKPLWQP